MASSTVNPDAIHVGRGDIYVGVPIPVTPPVALQNGIPLSGTFIGGTLEPASLNYKVTTVDVRTQQSGVLAISVVNTEDLELEFTIGEMTFNNLQSFILGSGISPFGSPTVSFGGQVIPNTTGLLMVVPTRTGYFMEIMIYQAYFPRDRVIAFAREKETMMKVTAVGFGQFNRARGDQLGFWNPLVVSG